MVKNNDIINRYRNLAQEVMYPSGSEDSLNWFREVVRKGKKITDISLVQEGYRQSRIEPGRMFTYKYDPKYAGKLKYYDENPLVIVLETNRTGWSGVNVHYLSPKLRSELLLDIRYRRKNYFRISEELKINPATVPSFKKYLAKQIKSKVINIPKTDWEIAIQLPYEAFVNEINKNVWTESRKKIR